MVHNVVCLRAIAWHQILALLLLASGIGCGSKEEKPTMSLQDAKYVLAEEASRVQPLEVTRDAIQADIDKHDNPRRGERPPTSTRAELEQSLAKVEAELVELNQRVELAKEVVEKEAAKAKK